MKNKNNKTDKARSYLTNDELNSIERILGRVPNDIELNMFAAMWSEHISYKSSIKWIEELPDEGENVKVPAMSENAGVIDFDEEYACVVKLESHNHPTAVNPAEAAVGVGNVMRDLLAMGAMPVALCNVMRFGKLDNEVVKLTVNKVVKALGSYSNRFGVPVAGGEVLFHDSFTYNPLLNILAVGLVKKDKIITSSLKKAGDKLFLIGQKTTGEAVHGAGFASEAFVAGEEMEIQDHGLADPYAGKVLLEAILELSEAGYINSMQDIGAGGVLCAASEMADHGGLGVRLSVEKIPVSDQNLSDTEVLLSQSQEQMLIAVSEENVDSMCEILDKWSLTYAHIGDASEKKYIRILHGDKELAHLPVSSLVRGGGAPVYIRPLRNPERKKVRITADTVPFPGSLKELAKQMISLPNVASRKYLYEQVDTSAGLSNVGNGYASDAGLVSLPGRKKMVALSVDGNSRYVCRDARTGTMIAVAEAARNIVCSGARPVAIANGLNFGDPSNMNVFYDFTESIKGIKAMSERMKVPVVAGNVSFNNLTKLAGSTHSILPTPVIGMVGVLDDKNNAMSVSFKEKGDMIFIIGQSSNDISASEYLSKVHFIEETAAPELDVEKEIKLQKIISELIENKYISSAHDVSLGGLFVSLVESCLANNLGFDITSPAEVREDAFLFGESQSRVVVSVNPDQETDFLDYMIAKDFPFSALGHVTKQELRIDDSSFGFITDYARSFENALGDLLKN